jgi:hypothetical protein
MPKLNRKSYLVICILFSLLPAIVVFMESVLPDLGLNFSIFPKEYSHLVGTLNTFLSMVLTYPAGAVGTIVSLITIYFGILTSEEAFLLTTPLYIAAGYFQWYVMIPKYFQEKNATTN